MNKDQEWNLWMTIALVVTLVFFGVSIVKGYRLEPKAQTWLTLYTVTVVTYLYFTKKNIGDK